MLGLGTTVHPCIQMWKSALSQPCCICGTALWPSRPASQQSLHLPEPKWMWRLQEQQPGDGSLTEGGTDAAINVLDPMNLIQGLHCILGKMVLQDSIQRVRGSGSPPHHTHPHQVLRTRDLGILEIECVDGSCGKEAPHLQL